MAPHPRLSSAIIASASNPAFLFTLPSVSRSAWNALRFRWVSMQMHSELDSFCNIGAWALQVCFMHEFFPRVARRPGLEPFFQDIRASILCSEIYVKLLSKAGLDGFGLRVSGDAFNILCALAFVDNHMAFQEWFNTTFHNYINVAEDAYASWYFAVVNDAHSAPPQPAVTDGTPAKDEENAAALRDLLLRVEYLSIPALDASAALESKLRQALMDRKFNLAADSSRLHDALPLDLQAEILILESIAQSQCRDSLAPTTAEPEAIAKPMRTPPPLGSVQVRGSPLFPLSPAQRECRAIMFRCRTTMRPSTTNKENETPRVSTAAVKHETDPFEQSPATPTRPRPTQNGAILSHLSLPHRPFQRPLQRQ